MVIKYSMSGDCGSVSGVAGLLVIRPGFDSRQKFAFP